MKDVDWVGIDKRLASSLPKYRPYSYLEAMFSFTIDCNSGADTSVGKYVDLWHWPDRKVAHFLGCRKAGKKQRYEYALVKAKGREGLASVGVKGQKKEHKKEQIIEIIAFLNDTVGTNFKSTTNATRRHIGARLEEGFSVEDFKRVIVVMHNEWHGDPMMSKFLRPETLFGTKFEGYLNRKQRSFNGVGGVVSPVGKYAQYGGPE